MTAHSGTAANGARLARFAAPYRGMIVGAAALSVIASALALLPFWIMVLVTDALATGRPDSGSLLILAALAALGVLSHYLAYGFAAWLSHVSAYRVLADMRLEAVRKLGRMPVGRVTSRASGDVKTVLIDDIERLEVFLAHGLPDAVAAAVVWVSMTVWMFLVDWRLAIASILVVPIAFLAMRMAIRDNTDYGMRYGLATARMNAAIAETLTALPVVASYVRPSEPLTRVERSIRAQATAAQDLSATFYTRASAFYVLIAAGGVVVVPTAAWLAAVDAIDITTVVFFAIVSLGANAPLVKLFLLTGQIIMLIRSGKTVQSLLHEPDQLDTGTQSEPADLRIRFDGLTFGYEEDTAVLHDITLDLAPGSVTALVGPSGSGKSTIARLLTRSFDSEGITIGGSALADLPIALLNRTVTTVAQDPFLFSGTIAENIRMGRPGASEEEVVRAAEAARVTEFARHLPHGLDTQIGERGSALSGGQAQRVSIARTFLADTPVLVLDEATAHADPENEAAIQDALSELMHGRTLIVIAHRLPTIRDADQIVVLDEGRVVATGTHDRLLASDELYGQLWRDWDDLGDVERAELSEVGS